VSSEYYTKAFYEAHRNGAIRSAEAMVPLVLKLLAVRSAVDVGCGDGSWLAVFQKFGVEEILGVDGGYIDRDLLQIPEECFQAVDLTKPFHLERVFDLAVSLEVAEHLPAHSARVFVECLTRLAPVVLFSAAIPNQGGNNHLNEQWPEKWAELFKAHDYLPIDCIRKRVWQNDAVEWWYAQNTLLFARASFIEGSLALSAELEQTNLGQLGLVHPRQFLHLQGLHREAIVRAERLSLPSGVRAALRLLLVCLRNAIWNRLASPMRPPKKTGTPIKLPIKS
jgi:SAM-dependent methyltransferase